MSKSESLPDREITNSEKEKVRDNLLGKVVQIKMFEAGGKCVNIDDLAKEGGK